MNDVNERLSKYFNNKIRHFIKASLNSIEDSVSKYSIDKKFFKEKDGYYNVRKTILDNGNDLIRLIEIILSELEIVPKRAIVDISKFTEKDNV